jgi:hypothetical protein
MRISPPIARRYETSTCLGGWNEKYRLTLWIVGFPSANVTGL